MTQSTATKPPRMTYIPSDPVVGMPAAWDISGFGTVFVDEIQHQPPYIRALFGVEQLSLDV